MHHQVCPKKGNIPFEKIDSSHIPLKIKKIRLTVAQNLIFLAMVLINSTQRHLSEEGYVQK